VKRLHQVLKEPEQEAFLISSRAERPVVLMVAEALVRVAIRWAWGRVLRLRQQGFQS
jgi:hypothetical protein